MLPGMSLRIELRLPSVPDHACRRIENLLRRLPSPPGEVWVLSVQEYEDQDEWLLLATGGAEKDAVAPEWSHIAVEENPDELICTYARAVRGAERDPEFIARSVERLVCARSARVVAARRRGRA
jgi:hypothetical protein